MKKILIPTDFSAQADAALIYGVHLANCFGAEVVLFSSYEVYSTTGSFISIQQQIAKEVKEDLKIRIQKLVPTLKGNTTLRTRMARGNPIKGIVDLAEKEQVDLIIMGASGSGRTEGRFSGSITNGVVKKTKIPVLVIPKKTPFVKPQNLVLSIDYIKKINLPSLRFLNRIIREFSSALMVLSIKQFSDKTIDLFQGEDPLSSIPYSLYVNYENKDNVAQNIHEFCKEKSADWLCLIKHQRGYFAELFHDSLIRKETFHSDRPILILQEK